MNNARIAVVGCGYWGKNLVRAFHQLGALEEVCDAREEVSARMESDYGVRTAPDLTTLLQHSAIDAVVLATPAVQHCAMARQALEAGKDVFVEKPLALSVAEARELVELARKRRRILMVGHILEYHPAIRELKNLVRNGDLGKIEYVQSSRLNIGKLRTEENILWSFAPHDVAVLLALLREFPERVSAHAGYYINPRIADTTLTTCEFPSGVMAHIFVSWLHPFKEQKLCVVGDRAMAVFDDVEKERKLVVYEHSVQWRDRVPIAQRDEGHVVPLPDEEPLKNECRHFLECIAERKQPLTDGESGIQVLRVLDLCEQSLRGGGVPVRATSAKAYFEHPTAVIDEPCTIGKGTKIWHFAHVMPNATIGERCILGQNVLVASYVKIGNNVKIQNNVAVYTGVELEDDVFCGPSMVFTNVINPRSHIIRKNEYRRTLVKRGATLGANCTVVCGVTIGEYAFIAAGAVVTKSVSAYALMMGMPARQVGWMCSCGVRLPDGDHVNCRACGKHYLVAGRACREVAPPIAAPVLTGTQVNA